MGEFKSTVMHKFTKYNFFKSQNHKKNTGATCESGSMSCALRLSLPKFCDNFFLNFAYLRNYWLVV